MCIRDHVCVLSNVQVLRAHATDDKLIGGVQAISQLIRTRGLRGLFRGASMRMLEVALGGVIFFTSLEAGRAWLSV